jgi:DNA-binding PucR family transcriptional regulator
MPKPRRNAVAERLDASVDALTSAATERMDADLPWFRELSDEDKDWIARITRNGVRAFVDWFRAPERELTKATFEVFGTAPQALASNISLRQTVEMVRTTIDVVERVTPDLLGDQDGDVVRDAIMLFSREVAFAAADVYARAAEMRGAWDARLEALIVDSVLRDEADESMRSRAAALGWVGTGGVAVIFGDAPSNETAAVDEIRRTARAHQLDALCSVQGDRLVVVLGGVVDPDKAATVVAEHFGPGQIVIGPVVEDLSSASVSARSAAAGLRAVDAWPHAPRPVSSEDLLPERALSGDGHARRQLVGTIYQPLATSGSTHLETAIVFLESGGSIEATARAMFIHTNTVRYRLRKITEITGLAPTNPRDAYTLRVALSLGPLIG